MASLLHTYKHVPCTFFNRVFAIIYAFAIVALIYHHFLTLHHCTNFTFTSVAITISFFISDIILAFMWATSTSFRLRPILRQVFPENLQKVIDRKDFPAIDIFICTADPYKEPPMNVVNTALSLMAYDYPPEKISVYVSDDGGSELTLFAFMEAAKFAKIWLPFCRDNNIMDRCPEVYFGSNQNHHGGPESESGKIKVIYENMKIIVENVVQRGEICHDYITDEPQRQVFKQYRFSEFTRSNHSAIIHVLIESVKEKDNMGQSMPNLVYVSREKNKNSPHHFKAGALNSLLGFRYGSLVEDYFTGYRLQCEGWESIFCHPSRPAFLGDVPISLIDAVNQTKRWAIGLLEVTFSKYNPVGFGSRYMGFIMGLCYTHYAFWPILSIPITIYSLLPQIALLNGLYIFPRMTDPWFLLYIFLFLGAYGQDFYDFILFGSTFKRWWNDQRIWIIRGLSPYLFGLFEYTIKHFGITPQGFNVTSKVQDDEQSKRYDQGLMEFGVHSLMFVPFTTASIVNLFALIIGMIHAFDFSNFEKLFLQLLIAGFGVLNSWPIYEAMLLRTDKGRLHTRTTVSSIFLALVLYVGASLVM